MNELSQDRVSAYAAGVLSFARAEKALAAVIAEFPRVAETVSASAELSATLADPALPAARRQQIVEDVLGGHASPTTIGVVSMLVASGRAADLPAIASALLADEAAGRGEEVAEVRSAVPLTDDQLARLTTALNAATGRQVTVRNIVDPAVLGGVVTQIGDSVIDGSVRTRLNQLREAF